jgi:lipopolysaccharide/colanic/teichoic acid biosynthesis glycosyltransferase
MKRLFDISFSIIGLVIFSPIILFTILFIWLYDFESPFYTPVRMGKSMIPFHMYKFRSMVIDADKTGVNSTSGNDKRITTVGRVIRKFKLDEIAQFINVFIGEMSFVGPRPQVVEHVKDEYSCEEKKLLNVKPGITDISSIVFSDEGEILKNSSDPDKDYNLLIRPWKSSLGILYVKNQTFLLDITLIILTLIAIIHKNSALKFINKILINFNADKNLIEVCKRKTPLNPNSISPK